MDIASASRRRVFTDPEVVQEMLRRYRAGETLVSLGMAYGCDHTSVLYQVRKHGLYVAGRKSIRTVRERVLSDGSRFDHASFSWTCCGSRSKSQHRVSCGHFSGIRKSRKKIERAKRKARVRKITTPAAARIAPIFSGEKKNHGKFYHEYLQEEAKRRALKMRCAPKARAYGIPTGRHVQRQIALPSTGSPSQDQALPATILLDGISEKFD